MLGEVSWERMIRAVEKVRDRLLRASRALEAAGVPYAVVGGNAVHVVLAGEKVRDDALFPSPDVSESEPADQFQVVKLDALVRMKLTSYRDKDRTHLRDMIEVGLIDNSWLGRLPGEVASRLQFLLEHPE